MSEKGKGFVLDDSKMPRFEYEEKLPIKATKPKAKKKETKPKKSGK